VINTAVDDRRTYLRFYGVEIDAWDETFGAFANYHYILVPDYFSDGCITTEDTAASGTHKFLYPAHIKKRYWIEGRIEGEFCLAASGAKSTCSDYRVTICKVHDNGTETELSTTGWITVNDTLGWDAVNSVPGSVVGSEGERVYHYWIDCFEEKELSDYERIYLKIQINCDANAILMHSNDPQWTDVWFDLPLRM